MKTGKQIKVNDHKNYSVIYGCVDDKNPKSIYVNISTWAEPLSEYEENYGKIIKTLDKKIRQKIYNYLSENNITPFLKDKTIVDLDLRESGVRFGKRSFMCCELTLFQNGEMSINSDMIKNSLNNVSSLIIKEIFDVDSNFKFEKKK